MSSQVSSLTSWTLRPARLGLPDPSTTPHPVAVESEDKISITVQPEVPNPREPCTSARKAHTADRGLLRRSRPPLGLIPAPIPDADSLRLQIGYTPTYPDELPEIGIEVEEGELDEDEVEQLVNGLKGVGEDSLGMVSLATPRGGSIHGADPYQESLCRDTR